MLRLLMGSGTNAYQESSYMVASPLTLRVIGVGVQGLVNGRVAVLEHQDLELQ